MQKKENRSDEKKFLGWFFAPCKKALRFYILGIIVSLLEGFVWVYSIRFLKEIVHIFEKGLRDQFMTTFVIYTAVIVVFFVVKWILRPLALDASFYAWDGISEEYIKKYSILDNSETEKLGTGKTISMLRGGMANHYSLLDMIFSGALVDISGVLFSFVLIYTISQPMFLISLAAIIILLGFVWYGNKKRSYLRKKKREPWTLYRGYMVKIIMAKFEIMQSNKINHEIDVLVQYNHAGNVFSKKEDRRKFLMEHGIVFGIDIAKVVVIGFFAALIFAGSTSIAEFVGIMTVLGYVATGLRKISQYTKRRTEDSIDVRKAYEFLTTTKVVEGYVTGSPFAYEQGNIVFKKVGFGYEKKHQIFSKFDLHISGGKKTAFVGPSGGGKTTLIKLVAGYIKPDSGEIVVDGQKLSSVALQSYYSHIGYLTQEPNVFDGTILENLVYALPDIDLKDKAFQRYLHKIIGLAKCDFIAKYQNGRDTEIGERGVRLSGGQKQRLAIAKIMLKNPEIILLDEPTSAMDSFNEEEVTDALHNLFRGRTVIVAAHRLQTVKRADQIFYLENGKITEKGTHEELIKLGGRYKKMLDLQSGF